MKGDTPCSLKKRTMRRIFRTIFLAGSFCVAASVAPAADFRQLSGPEIKRRFAGMEFTDQVHWALVFRRDGDLTSFEMGAAGKGTWKVEKNELCLQYGREGRRCHEVWVSGNSVQLRSEGRLPEDGVLEKPRPRPAR